MTVVIDAHVGTLSFLREEYLSIVNQRIGLVYLFLLLLLMLLLLLFHSTSRSRCESLHGRAYDIPGNDRIRR
jgi:hypothetical protein